MIFLSTSQSRRLWTDSVSHSPAEVLSFKNRPEDRDLSAVTEISACLEFKALGNAV